MRRIFVFIGFLILTSKCWAATPPNIVVLLADDLGWNCVGYHNNEFQTPHIDSIAAEGIELDRFYVAPMCSPTRAGFMTGRYPIRFGCARAVIPPQRDFGLPLVETTIGEMLDGLGYQHRGVFGKWHLGHRRAKWHPLRQGFTHFHGHYNGAIDYFHLTREDTRDWHVNYETSTQEGYATDLIAESAANWISSVSKSNSPYFCYVPFNAPHSPFQAPDDAIEKYSDPAAGTSNKKREIYKAMIGRMDEGIGKILAAVDSTGKSDNTLVWFFSDNGGVNGLSDLNKPLRGAKLSVFEGGTRVPACVRWPARIEPGRKGDARCGYVDILPTLVAAAGGDASPSQQASRPLDGVNLLPILVHSDDAPVDKQLDRPWYSYHGQSGEADEHLAIIEDGWKLIVLGPRLRTVEQLHGEEMKVHLFQIDEDPLEQRDLSSNRNDVVLKLGAKLVQHRMLQPGRSIVRYSVGKKGFVPPSKWMLDPNLPNKLIGHHR